MFSQLFANNILVKLLRGDTGRYDLIVSMVGVKLGERLLQVGGGDGRLLAALGAKTGLTGAVAGVEHDEASAARVLDQATKAGVLADIETSAGPLPYDAGAFDIVVVPFPADEGAGLSATLGEAYRVLRDGGRTIVIKRSTGQAQPQDIVTRLQQQGFRAARLLAERNALLFYEGVKK